MNSAGVPIEELMIRICSYLPSADIARMAALSKEWYAMLRRLIFADVGEEVFRSVAPTEIRGGDEPPSTFVVSYCVAVITWSWCS